MKACLCTLGRNGRCCQDYGFHEFAPYPEPRPEGCKPIDIAELQRLFGQKTHGWACPKCGGVHAPHVPTCFRCGPKVDSAVSISPTTEWSAP